MENFSNLSTEKQVSFINAALSVFGVNGYKKASMQDIADAAGISKAMVFHYFGTKKKLYFYLIDYSGNLIMDEINGKFDNTITDFFDRILVASEIKLAVMKRHPAALTFLTTVYYETNDEVAKDIQILMSQWDGFRNKIAFDNMDISKFKEGIDPHLVLKMLLWMSEGFLSSSNKPIGDNLDTLFDEFFLSMKLMKQCFYQDNTVTE